MAVSSGGCAKANAGAKPVSAPGDELTGSTAAGSAEAGPASAVSAHVSWMRLSVRARKPCGAGMNSGAPPSNARGLTNLRRYSSQLRQESMWRATRLRVRTVNCPSQSFSSAASSGHAVAVRALRASRSAPRDRSIVSRSRCVKVRALALLTPSASASSEPSRPWRYVRSSTSRSRSESPPAASATNPASSLRAARVSGLGSLEAASGSSSDGCSRRRSRIQRSASLRAMAYSQGRSLLGSRSDASRVAAVQKVSCTQSAALLRSRTMPTQKSCRRSA